MTRLTTAPAKTRGKARGQNLVEFVLTIPVLLGVMFFTLEVGRVWYAYEAAKMAVNDGVHTAAIYHNPATGRTQMENKLRGADLQFSGATVTQVAGQHAYEGAVTVAFEPVLGGMSIPIMGGNIEIIPDQIQINYSTIQQASVY